MSTPTTVQQLTRVVILFAGDSKAHRLTPDADEVVHDVADAGGGLGALPAGNDTWTVGA